MRRLLITICLIVMAAIPALGEELRLTCADGITTSNAVEIYFKLNDERLHQDYKSNSENLLYLDSLIGRIDTLNIQSVDLFVQSSPEGALARNEWLTTHRTTAVREYFYQHYPQLVSKLRINSVTESWEELRMFVLEDTLITHSSRERILSVIDSDIELSVKKQAMKSLGNDENVGDLYAYLYSKYYTIIRGVNIRLTYKQGKMTAAPVGLSRGVAEHIESETLAIRGASIEPPPQSPLPSTPPVEKLEKVEKKAVAALKTNLLFDAVLAPNITVEVPIGDRLSVSVEDIYPWYHIGNKYCYEVWVIGPELRYYLKRPATKAERMNGHFVGLYAYSGICDFQNDFSLCYQSSLLSTGLTYGFALPLGKENRWKIEGAISGGYMKISYQHYYPSLNYDRLVRDKNVAGRITYYGPTNVRLSLVRQLNLKKRDGKWRVK